MALTLLATAFGCMMLLAVKAPMKDQESVSTYQLSAGRLQSRALEEMKRTFAQPGPGIGSLRPLEDCHNFQFLPECGCARRMEEAIFKVEHQGIL